MEALTHSGSQRHRVVILEDDPRTASELQSLLDASSDFVCGAVCSTVDQAATQARRTQPTVVLSDMRLQGVFRPDAISEIKRAAPKAIVLVLTAYEDPELLFLALRAGADGYLLKTDTTRPLLQALRLALQDAPPLSPRVARRILRHFRDEGVGAQTSGLTTLTARQRQVLERVHQGHSNPEIAKQLEISPDAVKMHVGNILARLRVSTRVEAAAVYERYGGKRLGRISLRR